MTFAELISMYWWIALPYVLVIGAALVLALWANHREINSYKAERNKRRPVTGNDFGAVGGPRFVRCAACDRVSQLDALTVTCPCGNVLSRWHSYAA